jgi:hypothetical protein
MVAGILLFFIVLQLYSPRVCEQGMGRDFIRSAPKTIGPWGGGVPPLQLQNTLQCKKGAVAPVQAKARDSLP